MFKFTRDRNTRGECVQSSDCVVLYSCLYPTKYHNMVKLLINHYSNVYLKALCRCILISEAVSINPSVHDFVVHDSGHSSWIDHMCWFVFVIVWIHVSIQACSTNFVPDSWSVIWIINHKTYSNQSAIKPPSNGKQQHLFCKNLMETILDHCLEFSCIPGAYCACAMLCARYMVCCSVARVVSEVKMNMLFMRWLRN